MYYENYKLAKFTWFKVGGLAEMLFIPKNLQELQNFLIALNNKKFNQSQFSKLEKYPTTKNTFDQEIENSKLNILLNRLSTKQITILGACSNVLISDSGIFGIVIKLGHGFQYINLEKIVSSSTILNNNQDIAIKYFLKVGAGTLNHSLSQYCAQLGVEGFEFLSSIPGTIGGGVYMNAGSYNREYKDILVEILCIHKITGQIMKFSQKDLNMQYRYSELQQNFKDYIVIEASFEINSPNPTKVDKIQMRILDMKMRRKKTQPISEKTGGSTFKNPEAMPAWQVVDKLNMRGFEYNGAKVSELHANFLINFDHASASDIWFLGEMIRKRASDELNIDLIWEIKRLGNWQD